MTDNIDIMDELDVQDMAVEGYDSDASDDETGQLYEHFRFEADPGMQPLRVDKYMCGCRCRLCTRQRTPRQEQLQGAPGRRGDADARPTTPRYKHSG